jgi:hypothetical protein
MGGKSGGGSPIDGIAGATPYGAAASAVSGLAAGGPSSSDSGDQGGATFGPIAFGGFKSDGSAGLPSWVLPVAGGAALLVVLALFASRRK